jgi:hypothetical protein
MRLYVTRGAQLVLWERSSFALRERTSWFGTT